MDDLKNFLGRESLTVSEAMRQIDGNQHKILFLTDDRQRLIGCVTDGDIRRFLLSGGAMSAPVLAAANRHPKSAKNMTEARALYHRKDYIVIPVIDGDGVIIDLFAGEQDEWQRPRNPLRIPVVINAGGRGTRLDPFTRVLPKPLIPVGELPIIELIMREYQRYACSDFHIIVNYKKELMKAYFADNERQYHISWYDEEQPLGTGGGAKPAEGEAPFHLLFRQLRRATDFKL